MKSGFRFPDGRLRTDRCTVGGSGWRRGIRFPQLRMKRPAISAGAPRTGCVKVVFASIALALMAVTAPAIACNNDRADRLFAEAVKLLVKADDRDADRLEKALKNLKEIRDCLSCSEISAALSDPRGIDGISIEKLERELAIRRKKIPASCSCSPTNRALKMAMGIETHYVRDDTIRIIIRNMVRRTGDFECARDVVELIGDDKKKKSLRQYIARARARAAFKKAGCGFCWEPRCDMSMNKGD